MKILSETPQRNPFEQARAQYESKQLSSTPISELPQQSGADPVEFPKSLIDVGIDGSNFKFNELGKVQLIEMLKQKYGDQFQQNPQAMKALSDFDAQYGNSENRSAINQGLANANRTLAALLGG